MNPSSVLNPKPLAALAALTLLVLALAIPGLRSMPVTDRDEARYAQASKQMVESGDYVQIRFLDEARNKKPAGLYWLHAASVRLTGIKDEIWPYRLVSVAGALLAVLLVYLLARRIQPDAPLLPAVALAACPLLVCVSHAAVTDTVVLATVCAAQLCLARVYLDARVQGSGFRVQGFGQTVGAPPRRRDGVLPAALGFWIALGIGILVKGPITPLIAGLTILALCLHDRSFRWLRSLRPAIGLPLLLLIVLPWLVAIQQATHGDFLRESLGHDFGAKLQGGQEAHGAPPGAYLLAANFLFWPLFPLAWRGIGRAWQARRTDPASLFLLAWLVPSWLVFELVPTKLPHYVLPLYPVLAFLAVRSFTGGGWKVAGGSRESAGQESGCQLKQGSQSSPLQFCYPACDQNGGRSSATPACIFRARLWSLTCHLADIAWWVGAAAFLIGPVLAARLLGWKWMPAAFGCAAVAGVAAAAGWRLRKRPAAAVAVAAGFALLFFVTLFVCILPRLDDLWLTRKVAGMVATQAQDRPVRVVSVGYAEPSMAFTFGTRTILTGGVERAVRELQQDPDAIALIQDAPAPPPKLLPVSDACWERLCRMVAVPPKNRQRERFLAAAAQAGVQVREAAAVDGFNYSRTKRVRVILYRNQNSEYP